MIGNSWCGISALAVRSALSSVGLVMLLAALAAPVYAGKDKKSVPEISQGATGSALTLLTGGVLVLTARLRRRN